MLEVSLRLLLVLLLPLVSLLLLGLQVLFVLTARGINGSGGSAACFS